MTVLGLYDSGLGGLTVLAALRAAGIDRDIVYFADQAHVPYGDRTDAELRALLAENFSLLATHGVDGVVMACNTSCAVASRSGGFPSTRFPIFDLIDNAAAALAQTPFVRIGVVATAATVRSGAYARAIARYAPHVEVIEVAAPALVPLVERGETTSLRAREAVIAVCAGLPADIDAVVYGCTHYPLLDAAFAAALGPLVVRLDPAAAQARAVLATLREQALPPGAGRTQYLTNGDLAAFEAGVRRIAHDATATFGRVAIAAAR